MRYELIDAIAIALNSSRTGKRNHYVIPMEEDGQTMYVVENIFYPYAVYQTENVFHDWKKGFRDVKNISLAALCQIRMLRETDGKMIGCYELSPTILTDFMGRIKQSIKLRSAILAYELEYCSQLSDININEKVREWDWCNILREYVGQSITIGNTLALQKVWQTQSYFILSSEDKDEGLRFVKKWNLLIPNYSLISVAIQLRQRDC